MNKLFARFVRDESGATAIEYGLIAALIAVVIIGAVTACWYQPVDDVQYGGDQVSSKHPRLAYAMCTAASKRSGRLHLTKRKNDGSRNTRSLRVPRAAGSGRRVGYCQLHNSKFSAGRADSVVRRLCSCDRDDDRRDRRHI